MDSILHRKSTSETASLHRAFLAMSSWCLDHAQPNEALVDDVEQQTVALEAALALARRAHVLTFPLHLPLYRRLMETLASGHHSSLGPPVLLIMEVSSWVASTLDAPVDAALFLPCLCRLVEGRRLVDAIELLTCMRQHHGIEHLDPASMTDILRLLQRTKRDDQAYSLSTQDSKAQDLTAQQDTPGLVTLLEASLLKPMVDAGAGLDKAGAREYVQALLRKVDEDDIEDLLEQLLVHTTASDDDDDEADNDAAEDDDDNDDLTSELSDENEVDRMDVLDSLAVQSVFIKRRIHPANVPTMLSDLIHKFQSADAGASLPTRPRTENRVSFPDPARDDHPVYRDRGESSDDEGDSDESEDGWRKDASKYLYDRGELDVPDLRAQMVLWNGGKELRFTKEFEDVMMGEFIDDAVSSYRNSRQGSSAGSLDSETDSDSDDSGDEY
jgi:hypothetical protein